MSKSSFRKRLNKPWVSVLVFVVTAMIYVYFIGIPTKRIAKNVISSSILDVKNETLGFERVFAISMPSRSDKRDSLSLAASFSGIKFDWIDGVDGTKIEEKALPVGWPKGETPATLACWRAHMNILQMMVKERMQTALIMEDDADWDVKLKSQLVDFAQGSQFILENKRPSTEDQRIHSPYGNFDLLWLGHCGARNREDEDQRYWVTHNDPTAVPQSQWGYPRRQPNLTPSALTGNFTRVVFEPTRGLCTTAYAISLRGARRLLHHQTTGNAAVSDRALQSICNSRYMGFTCLAPYPPLISSHKPAGATSKDSDREDTASADGGFRKVAVTGRIVYSARLNMRQLLMGEQKVVTQWPDECMVDELPLAAKLPIGKGVFVEAGDYKEFERPN